MAKAKTRFFNAKVEKPRFYQCRLVGVGSQERDVCHDAVLFGFEGNITESHHLTILFARFVLSLFGLKERAVRGVGPVGGEDLRVLGLGEFVAEEFCFAIVTDVLRVFTLAAILQSLHLLS